MTIVRIMKTSQVMNYGELLKDSNSHRRPHPGYRDQTNGPEYKSRCNQ